MSLEFLQENIISMLNILVHSQLQFAIVHCTMYVTHALDSKIFSVKFNFVLQNALFALKSNDSYARIFHCFHFTIETLGIKYKLQ